MTDHHPECEDVTGEYAGSCTCAIIKRREAMNSGGYLTLVTADAPQGDK